MLDNSFKLPKYEEKKYEVLPVDVYQASVEDISMEPNKFEEGEMQLKFTLRILDDGAFYGRLIWYYTSLVMKGGTKPTKLFRIMTALTGKTYEKEQCMSSDEWLTHELLNSFIGAQVRISVSLNEKPDKTMFNKVDNVLPAKEQKPDFDQAKMVKPL